jgi:hypothetical protein
MLQFVKGVWKDPVLSKLIAGGIGAVLLFVWRLIGESTFNSFVHALNSSIHLPTWLAVLFGLLIAALAWKLRPTRKVVTAQTPLITDIVDASARVDSWWPKPTGYFPDDVHVDYASLESRYSLAPGVAKKAVSVVALKHCYKEKIPGENFATFEYDHDRAHRG